MKKRSSLNRNNGMNVRKIFLGGLFVLLICCVAILGTLYSKSVVNGTDSYRIVVINNNTGGDVTNNAALFQLFPRTELTNEIVSAARNGTVMVTLGDGSEPQVMLVSGTHGAEIPSQVAAMFLINFLNGKNINGTIYIVPFAIPYNSANNIRFNNGSDPNRVAQIPGTPTNIIADVAKSNNIAFFGDFHSAQPNDIPGKNCIIYYPSNPKSLKLANYLKEKT